MRLPPLKEGFAVMKVKPASTPARKKTSARVVKSPPEKIVATDETSAAKPKSKSAKPEPKTEVTAETHVRRTYTRGKKTEVPSILLEGDSPAPAPASGPGEKFSLGATPPPQHFPSAESELPESYGTKKLFLTA